MAGKLRTHPSAVGRATIAQDRRLRLGRALEATARIRPGRVPVVSVRGELDLAGAKAFEDLVIQVTLSHGPDVVIDASGLSFCDARGLGSLVRCANEAGRAGGRLTLVHPCGRLRRLLRLVGLDRLLDAASAPAPSRPRRSCSTMSTDMG